MNGYNIGQLVSPRAVAGYLLDRFTFGARPLIHASCGKLLCEHNSIIYFISVLTKKGLCFFKNRILYHGTTSYKSEIILPGLFVYPLSYNFFQKLLNGSIHNSKYNSRDSYLKLGKYHGKINAYQVHLMKFLLHWI